MNGAYSSHVEKIKEINSQIQILNSGRSFAQILERCRGLREKMTEAHNNSKEKLASLQRKFHLKTEKRARFDKFKEKKEKVISADKNEMEKFLGLAKSRLDTINFKTLPKVKHDSEVEGLFRFLFIHLYKEKETQFDFDQFVKFAVKKNVGELKKRLAQFEIGNIGKTGLQRLEEVGLTRCATASTCSTTPTRT